MKDEDIDFNKYYELDCRRKYFSIDLQREVQFDGCLAVKPTHKSNSACGTFKGGGCLWFGKLVDVDINGLKDYDTNNEIEFVAEDVISEYEFKDIILPFILPLNSI
jgi:hypothetical protein